LKNIGQRQKNREISFHFEDAGKALKLRRKREISAVAKEGDQGRQYFSRQWRMQNGEERGKDYFVYRIAEGPIP